MFEFEQLIAKFPGLRFMDRSFFEQVTSEKPVYYNVKNDKIQFTEDKDTVKITMQKKYMANVSYKTFGVLQTNHQMEMSELVNDIFFTPLNTLDEDPPIGKLMEDDEDEVEFIDDEEDADEEDVEEDDDEYTEPNSVEMQRQQVYHKITKYFEVGKYYVYQMNISEDREISVRLIGEFNTKEKACWYVYTNEVQTFVVEPVKVDYFYTVE